jgi:pimeloyl-ACP methyl ester carboxylesterase
MQRWSSMPSAILTARQAPVARRSWGAWGLPLSRVEETYPTLSYFRETERGGHFAAWEEPELFASQLRAAFRPLR